MIFPVLLLCATVCLPRGASSDLRSGAARWAPLAASLAVLSAYAALRMTALRFPSDSTTPDTGIVARLIETVQALGLYLGLIFAPLGLHMERTLDDVSPMVALPGTAALLAMIVCAVRAYRTGLRRLAFALAWFVVTWAPISGIFPLNAPMAEHWLYVPLGGFLWALAEIAVLVFTLRPAMILAGTVTAAWALALVAISVDRNRDWRSNESIFRATLEQNPDSLRVRFNLAVTYEDLSRNPIGAIREFDRFLRDVENLRVTDAESAASHGPMAMEAGVSLGGLLLNRGYVQDAAQRYSEVLNAASGKSLPPDQVFLVAEASVGLGQCYQMFGDPQKAAEHFERAVQLRPELAGSVAQLRRASGA